MGIGEGDVGLRRMRGVSGDRGGWCGIEKGERGERRLGRVMW